MKNLIRRWLGIGELSTQITLQEQALYRKIHLRTEDIIHEVRIHNRAIGRIISKLEPMFGIPEDDPARKAASDKLGDDIIRKLRGEYLASKTPF